MVDGDSHTSPKSDRLATTEAHLMDKSSGKCPMCGREKWYIDDEIYAATVVTEDTMRLPGRYIPMVATICRHCGFVAWFSAVAIGVLDPEEEGETSDE
jgi:hypothetical protein